MNNWYGAGLLAAERRKDADREAAADALRKIARGSGASPSDASIPGPEAWRHRLASLGFKLRRRDAERRLAELHRRRPRLIHHHP